MARLARTLLVACLALLGPSAALRAPGGPVKTAPAAATAARATGGGDSLSPAKAVAPPSAGASADGEETLPKCGDVEEPPFLGNATHSGTANHTMKCDPDDVAFAHLAGNACSINGALKYDNRTDWTTHTTVGCYRLLVFNTDDLITSAVYQNLRDGRCVLAFSGIHRGFVGIAGLILKNPATTWKMCNGGDISARYVNALRQHTALSNWSRAMHLLSGENGTCRGEPVITSSSLGGALAEVMAFCNNAGRAREIQDPSLPNFPVQTLWNFGGPASSKRPLTNIYAKDGCFKGSRVFLTNDPIVHYSGKVFGLKHARQHALQLWAGRQPAAKGWPCNSTEAINDDVHSKPRGKHNDLERMKVDISQHESPSYEGGMEWVERNGQHDQVFESPGQGLKAFSTSEFYVHMRAKFEV